MVEDCITWNIEAGYIYYSESKVCSLIIWQDGTYLSDNEGRPECAQCHKSCLTCKGPGSNNCITCNKKYKRFKEDGPCLTCSEHNKGYFTSSTGKCLGKLFTIIIEICGDGYNMGTYECDDGNNIDGDGCSSTCKIEKGFECKREGNGRDICRDIISPKALLLLTKNTRMLINFDEIVEIKGSSSYLESTMKISLDGSTDDLSWKLNTKFAANKKLIKLDIELKPGRSLKGIEIYTVEFTDASIIVDCGGNTLYSTKLTIKAMKYIPISSTEEAILTYLGSTFNLATLLSFVGMLAFSCFQSTSLEMVWSFVNVLQILSYLPVLKYDIPWNLRLFLTEYATVKKIAIPFDMIPDFDIVNILEPFSNPPYNEKFYDAGYETTSFVINFYEEISSFFLIAFMYFLLTLFKGRFREKMYCSLLI